MRVAVFVCGSCCLWTIDAAEEHLAQPTVALGLGSSSYVSGKTRSRGFTTWQSLVVRWFEVGGRHLDTALKYGNNKEVGDGLAQAIQRGVVRRGEVFITCKFLLRDMQKPGDVSKMLTPLRISYIDLLMLHNPGVTPAERLAAWKVAVTLKQRHVVTRVTSA